jgi:hypothetical protein
VTEAANSDARVPEVPEVGDPVMVKALTLPIWLKLPVTHVEGDYLVVCSGMGARTVPISEYGKSWRRPRPGE